MAKIRFKKKWTSVIAGVLVAIVAIGSMAGLISLLDKDTRTLGGTLYAVGGVDWETGEFIETDRSIYTKDLFECEGLTVEPDFEAKGTFRVFYYDADEQYLGASAVMNANEGSYSRSEFPYAKYARLVITPGLPIDEAGAVDEDFRIRFWEPAKYAGQYTVSVAKTQHKVTGNIFVVDEEHIETTYCFRSDKGASYDAFNNIDQNGVRYSLSELIKVNGYEKVYISEGLEGGRVCFWTEDKLLIENTYTYVVEGMDIPKGAFYVTFQVTGSFSDSFAVYAVQ